MPRSAHDIPISSRDTRILCCFGIRKQLKGKPDLTGLLVAQGATKHFSNFRAQDASNSSLVYGADFSKDYTEYRSVFVPTHDVRFAHREPQSREEPDGRRSPHRDRLAGSGLHAHEQEPQGVVCLIRARTLDREKLVEGALVVFPAGPTLERQVEDVSIRNRLRQSVSILWSKEPREALQPARRWSAVSSG